MSSIRSVKSQRPNNVVLDGSVLYPNILTGVDFDSAVEDTKRQQQKKMTFGGRFSALALAAVLASSASAFVAPQQSRPPIGDAASSSARPSGTSSTSLYAIGVLARKAKEADLRKYCADDIEESTLEQVKLMKAGLEAGVKAADGPGPLQQSLTKRKGTISIVAEYKKKLLAGGYIDEIFEPSIMSSAFREFFASAVSVMADERMGGCNYDDVRAFADEQAAAKGDMPGPCPVICNDLIVDEVQIARSKAFGAGAVGIDVGVVGAETFAEMVQAARALELEVVGEVSTAEEAQQAVDAGCTILSVLGSGAPPDKYAVVSSLSIPEGTTLCTINHILAKNDKGLMEVEEAWISRDLGFNAVWVADALYKNAAEPTESPGAVIAAMRAKSSVKWASPKARSGKGEGAREYLGDIMM